MSHTLEEKVNRVIKKAVENKEIPYGSLLVRKGGEEVLYTAQGVERDAIFRIYSMTKPVTGAAVMKLIEDGELEYNAPVSKFLPGFKEQKVWQSGKRVPVEQEITVKHLMNMTSGLVYGNENTVAGIETQTVFDELDKRLFTGDAMSTIELANRLGGCSLLFQPGAQWEYGVSADILGAVVEVVTGGSYGEFLQRELFLPLGMTDTGFTVPEEKRHRLVTSYQVTQEGDMIEYHGNHLGIINGMNVKNPAFLSGGAGLTSTIDDYSHFAQMLLNGGTYEGKEILKERTVRFLTTPRLSESQCRTLGWSGDYDGFNYGNLMRIIEDERKAPVIGSKGTYGWDGWLGTFFANSPLDEMTILFMTQKKDAGWLDVVKRLHNVIFSELTK